MGDSHPVPCSAPVGVGLWDSIVDRACTCVQAPSTSEDPLDVYCGENPDADECRWVL